MEINRSKVIRGHACVQGSETGSINGWLPLFNHEYCKKYYISTTLECSSNYEILSLAVFDKCLKNIYNKFKTSLCHFF